ncbi:Pms2 protein, partial [Exidia glandulosa HHB12029]
AEETLSRIIHKADFSRMRILGQFNLGFIIARLRGGEEEDDDLFVIDQHASDEKYNFETLQETTKMETQRLLRPRPLELTAADELLAIERIDVLRKNGFDLEVDEDAPAHQRIKLTAIPVSKNTSFSVEDLEELIHLLRDSAPGQMARCSKVRAMFAMRACRKSVMIGDALNMRQMKEIVSHMGTMDQPWNCPHGRPTMRHLASLQHVQRTPPSTHIDWDTFMEHGL